MILEFLAIFSLVQFANMISRPSRRYPNWGKLCEN